MNEEIFDCESPNDILHLYVKDAIVTEPDNIIDEPIDPIHEPIGDIIPEPIPEIVIPEGEPDGSMLQDNRGQELPQSDNIFV